MALPERHPVTIPLVKNVDVLLSGSKNLPVLVCLVGQSKDSIAGRVFVEGKEETAAEAVPAWKASPFSSQFLPGSF